MLYEFLFLSFFRKIISGIILCYSYFKNSLTDISVYLSFILRERHPIIAAMKRKKLQCSFSLYWKE